MENLKNSLVLFDVDGTLTEARQRINKRMLQSLKELSFNTEIGLLTGSGLNYIKEQLWPLLADPDLSLNCHVLPCNGIEYYIPNPDSPGNFIEIHRNFMEKKIGFENLTLAPIEKDLINYNLLSKSEKDYLFKYHLDVYSKLSKYLSFNERKWLASYI